RTDRTQEAGDLPPRIAERRPALPRQRQTRILGPRGRTHQEHRRDLQPAWVAGALRTRGICPIPRPTVIAGMTNDEARKVGLADSALPYALLSSPTPSA